MCIEHATLAPGITPGIRRALCPVLEMMRVTTMAEFDLDLSYPVIIFRIRIGSDALATVTQPYVSESDRRSLHWCS